MITEFLKQHTKINWYPRKDYGLTFTGLYIGKGKNAIEIVVANSTNTPNNQLLQRSWKERRSGRASPVLLVVLSKSDVSLCGPTGDTPSVYRSKDIKQIERLCNEVLELPDRHAALEFLTKALRSLETELPGINNEGMLALHELAHGVKQRSDWEEAHAKATRALGRRNKELLTALGFQTEQLDTKTQLLRGKDRRMALAIILLGTETPEVKYERFSNLSPISYALKKADDEQLLWVIVLKGNWIRLYSTDINCGVGRKGRTETYIECQLSLLSSDHLSYLWLLFSADALVPQSGSLQEIIDDSERFAGNLAERLRERIYNDVVPTLSQGIAEVRNIKTFTAKDLSETYEMALIILFRLLFVAYAEDRDLLPYQTNRNYRNHSLKDKAQDLAKQVANNVPIAEGNHHWHEIVLLWSAVAIGNRDWGVPAYDGGLFTEKPEILPAGSMISELVLPNEIFGKVLRDLLVIDTKENTIGPVDFRSLGVREFGTIYEGLLESELAVAEDNLVIKSSGNDAGTFFPAKNGVEPDICKGSVYLHNQSGIRKSSGSYYTKSFVVEHLLDGALIPALNSHLDRLDELDDTSAAEAFFDFRVADIAMGSGHFLIGAIDAIEKYMSHYLAKRNLPGIQQELIELHNTASEQLKYFGSPTNIEDGQMLRRLIARRCIYGVDINSLSVQLARLAIWIHTFVPGLPLSFLDRNLVHGNALVGIGNIDEVETFLNMLSLPLFPINAEKLLGQAEQPLRRLANANDATLRDIEDARNHHLEVKKLVDSTKGLFDMISAQLLSDDSKEKNYLIEQWFVHSDDEQVYSSILKAQQNLKGLDVLHFPVAFPEVFLRQRSGFDVILGNPPWEEATIEEHAFWARHFPGLRGKKQEVQEVQKSHFRKERPDLVMSYEVEQRRNALLRRTLLSGNYPGMGSGDPDLYKAFCWRFWNLTTNKGGLIGVVLPQNAFVAKGSTVFRKNIFSNSSRVDVTTLINRGGWVFSDVHNQYIIGLVCIEHGIPNTQSIRIKGPYTSVNELIEHSSQITIAFSCEQVFLWNDTASLPLLPDNDSLEIFAQLRKYPRLDLTESDEGGGGGEHVPTENWMQHFRKVLWISTTNQTVESASTNRTTRHLAKKSNEFGRYDKFGWLLASIQRGVISSMESRYRDILCMG